MAQNSNLVRADPDYSKVVDILSNMFGQVMNSDAIFAIVDSCDGELTNSIDAIMKIMEDSDDKPTEKSDSPASDPTPSSTSQEPANTTNISTSTESRPNTLYAHASLHSGAVPKTRQPPAPLRPWTDFFWTDQTKRIIEYHNKCYRTFIALRGVPGSGKSHLGREIIEKTVGPGDVNFRAHIFSTDHFFYKRGRYMYDKSRLSEAHDWNQRRVQEALPKGISPVILDNTNVELWEMEVYVRAAVNEGYYIELIEPNTPWARNPSQLFKKNSHDVPMFSIKRMLDKFQGRGISGNDLLKSLGICYPADKIPPVPRAIPTNRFHQNRNTTNDIDQNVQTTVITGFAAPEQNAITPESIEINVVASSNDNDSQQPSSPMSHRDVAGVKKVFESISKEWDMGGEWEENRQDNAFSIKNQSDEPKPQRSWKLTPSDMPWFLHVPEGQDWSTITKFMPVWNADLPPTPTKINVTPVETKTSATCVEIGDTDLYSVNNKSKVLIGTPKDINLYYMPREEKIPDRRKLDKSSSTNDQLITESFRCANEEKHFIAFRKLFKHISRADLRDIFEKCCGDVNWAVGIVLDGVASNAFDTIDEADHSDMDEVGDEQCECTAAYSIRPDSERQNPTEESALESTVNNVLKKVRKDKSVSEASMQLKKQIEQNVVIGDNHYSNHCLKIRKFRRGEVEDNMIPVDSSEAGTSQAIDIPNAKKDVAQLSHDESPTKDNVSECSDDVENTVNINLGSDFVKQLDNIFGRTNMSYSDNIVPMISIPMSTLNELNALWMESVSYQIESQTNYSEILLKQDEEFARQLSETEAELLRIGREPEVPDFKEIMDIDHALNIHHKQLTEQIRNNEPNDLAARMTRDKLNNLFPDVPPDTLSEMLMAHDNNFQTTVEILLMSTGQADVLEEKNGLNKFIMKKELERQKKLLEDEKKEEFSEEEWPMLSEAGAVDMSTVERYRREAQAHLDMRNVQYQKSLSYMRRGMTTAAAHCSSLARYQKSQFEQSNLRAAAALIQVNSVDKSNTTLDLHQLYVAEAMESLDLFVDHHISLLRNEQKHKNSLFLITGRGAHSRGGPRVKPSVRRRLRARGFTVTELNPGLLTIGITSENKLTHELPAST